MKTTTACLGILSCIMMVSCIYAQQQDSHVLKGPYLGQKPPGMKPEIFAPGMISSGVNDMDITFTPDGSTVYFSRSGPDWFSAILSMEKVDDKWIGPFLSDFTAVNSSIYPFASPNGNMIFFDSDADIYFSEKSDKGWSSPMRLDSNISTNGREGFASVAFSGNLYFTANYEDAKGGMDIYMSAYLDGAYAKATNLGDSINSEHNEFHSCISPDEGYIIFDSQRPGGFGQNDLYISFRRKDGTWTKARNMGKPINTEASDMRPYITSDGEYLFFSSTRSIPIDSAGDRNLSYEEFSRKIAGPGNGSQDIYWVNTEIIDILKREILTE